MTKIRGGKQAYDQLLADLQVVKTALRDIDDHAHIVRLVKSMADDGLIAVRSLETLITNVVGPMLERRDRHAVADIAEFERRLHEQEWRIAALETHVAQLELERRGVAVFPDRKQERG